MYLQCCVCVWVCVCVCVCVLVVQLCLTLCDLMDCGLPWNSLSKNIGVGSHSLLQGILSAQGLNPGLPHCRNILLRSVTREAPITFSCVLLYSCFYMVASVIEFT